MTYSRFALLLLVLAAFTAFAGWRFAETRADAQLAERCWNAMYDESDYIDYSPSVSGPRRVAIPRSSCSSETWERLPPVVRSGSEMSDDADVVEEARSTLIDESDAAFADAQWWAWILATSIGLLAFATTACLVAGSRISAWMVVGGLIGLALVSLPLGFVTSAFEMAEYDRSTLVNVASFSVLAVIVGAFVARRASRHARGDRSRRPFDRVVGAALVLVALACLGILGLAVVSLGGCEYECGGVAVFFLFGLLVVPVGALSALGAWRLLRRSPPVDPA